MTDNLNVGTEAPGGADGTPSQSVSPQAQQPIDSDATKLLASLESKFVERFTNLEKQITGLGGVQSRIDQSQNAFQAQLARYNQLTEKGFKPEEAITEMQRVDADAQWRQSLESKLNQLAAALGSGGTAPGAQQMVAKVFEQYQLDPKDPYVASQLQGKSFANETEAELFAARVFRDKALSPNPNLAQQSSTPGAASGSNDVQAKIERLTELQRTPTRNRDEILRLTAELESVNWGGR
jgi:hypothetical protein